MNLHSFESAVLNLHSFESASFESA